MSLKNPAVILVSLLLAAIALAAWLRPTPRYMLAVNSGAVVRLDTSTGTMTVCRMREAHSEEAHTESRLALDCNSGVRAH